MKKIAAVLAAVVASLCVAAPAYAGPLHAVTQDPIGVTDSGVTLKGQVTPAGAHTAYYFDYGTTVAYGAQTPVGYVTAPPVAQAVQAQLNGLASGTTYHFRLVAVDGSRVDYGNDLSFTTSGLPGAGGGGGPGGLTGSGTDAGTSPIGSGIDVTETRPQLGKTVGAGRTAGTVLVKLPGHAGFAALNGAAPIPVGSTIDARHGTVAVVTAVSGGGTQSASFRGSVFQIRQARSGGGMTDIVLRGGDFAACAKSARRGPIVSAAARPRVVRQLWGHDHGGRFRTHGAHAIAIVRGTTWITTDRCDGTLTRVTSGAVSVRDLGRRASVLVRAGKSYLARAGR